MIFFGHKREAAEVENEAFQRDVLGRVDDESDSIDGALEQLSLDGGYCVGNPLADFWMAGLADAVVVFLCRQERVA